MRPHSALRSRGGRAPSEVSQDTNGEVRPSASTTRSASISSPRSVRAPVTVIPRETWADTSSTTRVLVMRLMLASASTARRSALSNTGRRAQIETNSSSCASVPPARARTDDSPTPRDQGRRRGLRVPRPGARAERGQGNCEVDGSARCRGAPSHRTARPLSRLRSARRARAESRAARFARKQGRQTGPLVHRPALRRLLERCCPWHALDIMRGDEGHPTSTWTSELVSRGYAHGTRDLRS